MTQFSKKGGAIFFSEIVKMLGFGPPPPQTPTSGGRVDLWSKIAFLILVWDDTIFKKKGGSNFFPKLLKIVKTARFWTPPKHPLPEVV